jgi:hypothetical protein
VTALDRHDGSDDYERLLRGLYTEGKLDAVTFRQLLQHSRKS